MGKLIGCLSRMLLGQQPWRWDRNRTERWGNRQHYQSPEKPDLCCKEEHALLCKGSVCSTSTSLAPPTNLLPRVCVFSWSHIRCELIQCGRTVKAWLDPRGERVARKGRKNGGREREWRQGAHNVREVNEWKILHGGENEREEQLNEGVAGTG